MRYRHLMDYNEAEQLVLKKTTKITQSPFEESEREVKFEYNKEGLLQKESGPGNDLWGPSEWRKVYEYFYF